MMHRNPLAIVMAVSIATIPVAGFASNVLLPPGARVQVAHNTISATPSIEWNRLSARLSRYGETWTRDGPGLNDLSFYGGVIEGQPLLREVDRRNRPMPRFSASMLTTDIPTLLDSSYRIARGAGSMDVTDASPATLGGAPGIRFSYQFTGQDEVRRRGEAVGAIVRGKLYLVTFEAPVIFYFDRDAPAARAVFENVTID